MKLRLKCRERNLIVLTFVYFLNLYIKTLQRICERITPRLVHINPAVVFSAVKVLVRMMDYIKSQEFIKNLNKKISPALGDI